MGQLKDESRNTVSDDVRMANVKNNTFKALFMRDNVDEFLESAEKLCRSEMMSVELYFTDAAAGPDEIGPRVLKELVSRLAPAMAVIFNLAEGEFPDEWRETNVTSSFKVGTKSNSESADLSHSHWCAVR